MREFVSIMPWTAVLIGGSVTLAVASETDSAQIMPVTEETFIRAEVDARILRFIEAGGMNKGLVYDAPTPVDNQAVPRQNRDTLYAGIPIDTSEGFTITLPEVPDGRYMSVYMIDNDHFASISCPSRASTNSARKKRAISWRCPVFR